MNYWLVKSEPNTWSWDDHLAAGVAEWDGVRNYQANNNLAKMANGDKAFFYHSVKQKQIVGILEVVREHYPDPSDETNRFGMVDFRALQPMPHPVTLQQIKQHPELQDIALIKQSRLSVMPIRNEEWRIICALGGVGDMI
jgi:predicted RNA-binding protein with PUA-like domain